MKKTGLTLVFLFLIQSASGFLLNPGCRAYYLNDEISVIEVVDLDGDGFKDVLVGTSKNGVVESFIYAEDACETEWVVEKSDSNYGAVEDLELNDFNADGQLDVAVSVSKSHTPKPENPRYHVYALDARTFVEFFKDKEYTPQASSVSSMDVDGDGALNIIGAGKRSVVAYTDVGERNVKYEWMHETPLDVFKVEAVEAGENEFKLAVVSTSRNMTVLEFLDADGKISWSAEIPYGVHTSGGKDVVDYGDVDEDGVEDVFVAAGSRVYAYSPVDGLIFSHNLPEESRIVSSISFMEGYGVLAGARPYAVMIDCEGVEVWRSRVDSTVYDIDSGDVTGDGTPDVAVSSYGLIYLFNVDGGLLTKLYKPKVGVNWLQTEDKVENMQGIIVGNVKIADLDDDGVNELVISYSAQSTGLSQNIRGSLEVFRVDQSYTKPASTTSVLVKSPEILYEQREKGDDEVIPDLDDVVDAVDEATIKPKKPQPLKQYTTTIVEEVSESN